LSPIVAAQSVKVEGSQSMQRVPGFAIEGRGSHDSDKEDFEAYFPTRAGYWLHCWSPPRWHLGLYALLSLCAGKLEIVTSPVGRDGLRILVLKGRLTIDTVASFQDAIRKEHAQELIVDMSGVLSMDSAGLGVMIAAYVDAKKTSRKVGFAGMNERVKAVTGTSRLSQLLQIFAMVKDAEAALSNSW
jgi:anti-anti-sigma factor